MEGLNDHLSLRSKTKSLPRPPDIAELQHGFPVCAEAMDDTSFDPSLPGVRRLHAWTREQRLLGLELPNGTVQEGVLQWQNPDFLALRRTDASRRCDQPAAILVIRPLPGGSDHGCVNGLWHDLNDVFARDCRVVLPA